jgi:hypothetical protein
MLQCRFASSHAHQGTPSQHTTATADAPKADRRAHCCCCCCFCCCCCCCCVAGETPCVRVGFALLHHWMHMCAQAVATPLWQQHKLQRGGAAQCNQQPLPDTVKGTHTRDRQLHTARSLVSPHNRGGAGVQPGLPHSTLRTTPPTSTRACDAARCCHPRMKTMPGVCVKERDGNGSFERRIGVATRAPHHTTPQPRLRARARHSRPSSRRTLPKHPHAYNAACV